MVTTGGAMMRRQTGSRRLAAFDDTLGRDVHLAPVPRPDPRSAPRGRSVSAADTDATDHAHAAIAGARATVGQRVRPLLVVDDVGAEPVLHRARPSGLLAAPGLVRRHTPHTAWAVAELHRRAIPRQV